tara:strand:- start:17 stop:1273 length:1257 start_codon:yes stop_codon:yes gene_type:complete
MNNIFGLIDCNNFYASCERVFQPKLNNSPIVVLSNNDGCIIARSEEAKLLGIPMGAPYHKYTNYIKKNKINVFSSNYEFYGDMSERVMSSIKMLIENENIEIYSIDEAFIKLPNNDPFTYSKKISSKIMQWTGIPTSIGISDTKTLSKIANHVAKKRPKENVFDMRDEKIKEKVMKELPVNKIWGISKGWSEKLRNLDIHTALELRDADSNFIKKKLGIVVERIVLELRGISCLDIEKYKDKKSIIASKSFGSLITDINLVEQALSNHVANACKKLRIQNTKAKSISIFIQTNKFRKDLPQYIASESYILEKPSSDTAKFIKISKRLLNRIFKNKYMYHKCGVILNKICSNDYEQKHMFIENNPKIDRLMKIIDTLNSSIGKDSVFHASQGTRKEWKMKRKSLSPCYTTKWENIPIVK